MSVILVIDKHGVYRSGIRELIEDKVKDSSVVEGSEFERLAANKHYDLILIDAESLSDGWQGWLKSVRELNPDTRFAIMSTSTNRADVLSCLAAGFHGFVHKLQSDEELLAAINDLLSGRTCVPRWLVDGDNDRPQAAPPTNAPVETYKLTRRQSDILPLIAKGMSNKEISSHLDIAEGTTKIHMAALLRALGARNRTEAAFIAAKLIGSNIRSQNQLKKPEFILKGLSGPPARL